FASKLPAISANFSRWPQILVSILCWPSPRHLLIKNFLHSSSLSAIILCFANPLNDSYQGLRIFRDWKLFRNATDLHPQEYLRHLTLCTKNDRINAVLEDKT